MRISIDYMVDGIDSGETDLIRQCQFSISNADTINMSEVTIVKEKSMLSIDFMSDLITQAKRSIVIIYQHSENEKVLFKVALSGCVVSDYSWDCDDYADQEKIRIKYEAIEVHSSEYQGDECIALRKFGYDAAKSKLL